MKKIIFLVFTIVMFSCSNKYEHIKNREQDYNIVPKPVSLKIVDGKFLVDKNTKINGSKSLEAEGNYLADIFNLNSGLNVSFNSENNGNIILALDNTIENDEGYTLEVAYDKIVISGKTATGVFYGIQTLRQLMPVTIESSNSKLITIPAVSIKDNPRFKWRAYMLDESRYFHGEAFVKKMLDEMALLKMNVFHWHLTDDAGWRIEIKKYPKLTEIGSKRKDSEIGTWGSLETSGEPHSGFYTQEQIKDIVAYAAERHITIVPEFEMPGHSSSAIAAYTWLGTAGKPIEVPVKFGRHFDNYDVTKPEVIQFIKDVLNEMFKLFPSEVIHIGGDEVGYKVWEESPHVQQYMKENGLKTPADLQIAFTNDISKFIEQKGKRMMGWNEIMGTNIHKGFEEKQNDKDAETALAKNVIVHFWKGDIDLATKAAEKGYGIVNSLHSNTYLDYGYKDISLEKAYGFNPIPKDLAPKYHANVYGLGCQMWSEWTPTNKDVEYQTFPRIAAYAEVGWTQLENKDYTDFKQRLKKVQNHWDNKKINYAKDMD